jgi:hypothetical protein
MFWLRECSTRNFPFFRSLRKVASAREYGYHSALSGVNTPLTELT